MSVASSENAFERAISEAKRSKPETAQRGAHPLVGAVLVNASGKIIAAGYRGESGPGDHAEYGLLDKQLNSSSEASGGTLYTTLEPCTKRSKDKIPCADRIADSRIAKVWIGMLDPNQNICGRGVRRLREAGIEIQLFPANYAAQVEAQNRDFTRAQLALAGVAVARQQADFDRLDYKYDWNRLLSRESVLIVIGNTTVCELLDRYTAAELQQVIDAMGSGKEFRRAVIMPSSLYLADQGAPLLRSLPVISLGSPKVNSTTALMLADTMVTRWDYRPGQGAYLRKDNGPNIALWGGSAGDTRETVGRYIRESRGLTEFLQKIWSK